MLEELCRSAMIRACHDVVGRERIVKLKGDRGIGQRVFAGFFGSSRFSFDWDFLPMEMFYRTRKGSTARKAWVWFNENADKLCEAFIEDEYCGDLTLAMMLTGTFDALFGEFLSYFAKRREKFMEQTDQALQLQRAGLEKQRKAPQSHGGVANLLKILTRTMQQQGSSIYTIAKVQYAVCTQAGIYIPEEFMTDVLVAGDILDDA